MCSVTYAANFCSAESWPRHPQNSENNVNAILLIEIRKGVEKIDGIAAMDGVDYLFFGPGDLSNDMGIDLRLETERLKHAWDKASHAAHSRGKRVFGVGFLGFDANADLGRVYRRRSTAARMACAASVGVGVALRAPRCARHMGVLAVETITASRMFSSITKGALKSGSACAQSF